jgi:hypothetical protein
MTRDLLIHLIFTAGLLHFSILIASALVPIRLNWKQDLQSLPRLHRQMYWTYGGYIVLCIIAFGCISTTCANQLADGSRLSRAVCLFIAIFWTIRLGLQFVFDVDAHLKTWWLRWGYRLLGVLFAGFAVIYGFAGLGTTRG